MATKINYGVPWCVPVVQGCTSVPASSRYGLSATGNLMCGKIRSTGKKVNPLTCQRTNITDALDLTLMDIIA